jgi:hypothetical protein
MRCQRRFRWSHQRVVDAPPDAMYSPESTRTTTVFIRTRVGSGWNVYSA